MILWAANPGNDGVVRRGARPWGGRGGSDLALGGVAQLVMSPEDAETTRWLSEKVGVSPKLLLTKIRQEVFKGEMLKPDLRGRCRVPREDPLPRGRLWRGQLADPLPDDVGTIVVRARE